MDSVMSRDATHGKKAVGQRVGRHHRVTPRARRLRRQLLCWIVSLSGSVRHARIKLVLLFWWGPRRVFCRLLIGC